MDENEAIEKDPTKKQDNQEEKKTFFERRISWLLIGVIFFILILFIGALLGVPKGINDRVRLAETQTAPKIQLQLDSAKLDLEEGRYQVALERLDWILEEMSAYLDDQQSNQVGELYSQTLLQISTSGSPTPLPSPTATVQVNTPTPDFRDENELFELAQEFIKNESWDEVIQTLEALREKSVNYKAVEVDGMLYIALRNRGMDKIIIEGSLEPGLYDLALAERFAPLDSSAEGVRTWTRYYLTGASYWGVDWVQVIFYFEQVYPQFPNLRDGTNMTAKERYRIALNQYGLQLAAAEEYCEAQEYFDLAKSIGPDPEIQPTAQWVGEECWAQENATPTPSPVESESTPSVEPTEEGTLEATPVPTESTPEG
jgi:tetratricopeptide (TPR) repeat protein